MYENRARATGYKVNRIEGIHSYLHSQCVAVLKGKELDDFEIVKTTKKMAAERKLTTEKVKIVVNQLKKIY